MTCIDLTVKEVIPSPWELTLCHEIRSISFYRIMASSRSCKSTKMYNVQQRLNDIWMILKYNLMKIQVKGSVNAMQNLWIWNSSFSCSKAILSENGLITSYTPGSWEVFACKQFWCVQPWFLCSRDLVE